MGLLDTSPEEWQKNWEGSNETKETHKQLKLLILGTLYFKPPTKDLKEMASSNSHGEKSEKCTWNLVSGQKYVEI